MIESVSLKNFRGFGELTVPLSRITMLTGANGAGKTSVLEGLYCLLSETRLDVAPLSRYDKSVGFSINQAANSSVGILAQQLYNYRLFWDECPTHGNLECSVEAKNSDGLNLTWEYKRAKLSDLDSQLTLNSPVPIDVSTEFALWVWHKRGFVLDKKSHQVQPVQDDFRRAQILTTDNGLYLLPTLGNYWSICRFLDFAILRPQTQRLSFSAAKQLAKALRIVNSHITDVRLKDIVSGLSVILDDKHEVSIGSIGNGAVTWASVLLAVFDMMETYKQQLQDGIPCLIMIDEMGTGIHYSAMLDVWKFLDDFSKGNPNIQFVFTSHSDDCIRAYCETFLERDVAAIVRLHETAVDGKIVPTEYKLDSFPDIIAGDWEVRG
jgi:hypothetical protein